MKTLEVTVPKLATIAATRGMLGFGAGLLVADLMARPNRRKVGWTLFAIGALSTLPIALSLFARNRARGPA